MTKSSAHDGGVSEAMMSLEICTSLEGSRRLSKAMSLHMEVDVEVKESKICNTAEIRIKRRNHDTSAHLICRATSDGYRNIGICEGGSRELASQMDLAWFLPQQGKCGTKRYKFVNMLVTHRSRIVQADGQRLRGKIELVDHDTL